MKKIKEKEIKQIRITVQKWVAELKEWTDSIHLEFVPLIRDDNKPITKDTIFILKEVNKNG